MKASVLLWVGLCLAVVLSACDESDIVAIRVRVQDDLSGEVVTSTLRVPASDQPLATTTEGVQWGQRVDMLFAHGEFTSLSELRVEDIEFRTGNAGSSLNYIEVVLPRGPAARWPRRMVPLSDQERTNAARAIDPSERVREVGAVVKIELTLPQDVVAHGVTPRARGSKEKIEGPKASLLVPLEAALVQDQPLVWHLTWRK